MTDDAIAGAPGADVDSGTEPGSPTTLEASCCSGDSLEGRLALFRDRLDAIYQNELELPLPQFRDESQHALHAFAVTLRRFQLPRQYFLDLAEGCRMDLTVRRYATWNALERYCYQVAGVVGLMMGGVFGLTHSDAAKHAVQLGNAMQLTNILRDLKSDWERGHLYLPIEDLARFRYGERDLEAGMVNGSFRELMRFEIDRTRTLYKQAAEGFCWLAEDGSRLTAATLATAYAGILGSIERQGYDVFTRRPELTRADKIRRLPTAWRLARRQSGQRLPRVF